MSPRSCGERNLAAHHMKHIDSTTLLLLDRGCPAFWLFALIFAQGAHFCARIAITQWHPVGEFLASGEREAIISLLKRDVKVVNLNPVIYQTKKER